MRAGELLLVDHAEHEVRAIVGTVHSRRPLEIVDGLERLPASRTQGTSRIVGARKPRRGLDRSCETALRAALEFERLLKNRADKTLPRRFIALCAGTDGIDGNSSAAGAISDQTTLTRARAQNLDAQIFLSGSNSYSFFAALGDALTTGPTGTNVRDLRIFLAE